MRIGVGWLVAGGVTAGVWLILRRGSGKGRRTDLSGPDREQKMLETLQAWLARIEELRRRREAA